MAFKFGSSEAPFTGFPIANAVIRFLQFILAITVTGLYGAEINRARIRHEHQDGMWVFAEVTAALSAITCLVYVIPKLKIWRAWPWDLLLLILWIVVFCVSIGIAYRHDVVNYRRNNRNLYSAVWVDFANLLLWLLTAIVGAAVFLKNRRSRSTFTGRAAV